MAIAIGTLNLPENACRHCGAALTRSFADLGVMPSANNYLPEAALDRPEPAFALHAYVCEACFLVQLPEMQSPEQLFSDYAYFSSYSDSWLKHAEAYAGMMTERFEFDGQSRVVEIASNDGYLLQYFKRRGVDILGIEPAENVARVARDNGIPTKVEFFGLKTAARLVTEGKDADLVVGNNVLAHVPDINDFVAGIRTILKPDGIVTMEFPHLLRMMREFQFDTIYHEHFSYLSFLTVERIFTANRMVMFDVEELPTHGGSLRIFACRTEAARPVSERVERMREAEHEAGLDDIAAYDGFGDRVAEIKRQLLTFLKEAKRDGKTVVGYGAPAKGNTLLNYCGVGPDRIAYTVDRSPHKQGMFLPGSRIPVYAPSVIAETKPDYVLILPWNLKDEIMESMAHIRDWGGRFVTPIPDVRVHP